MNKENAIQRFNDRMQRLRKGEKIKCTRCENGYVSAVGEPATAKVFRCDECGVSMIFRISLK